MVSDYFPTAPGTKWTFDQDSDGAKDQIVYTALAPAKVGRVTAIPIEQDENGSRTTLYYKVDNDDLLLLGTDPINPFSDPRPLIRANTLPTSGAGITSSRASQSTSMQTLRILARSR